MNTCLKTKCDPIRRESGGIDMKFERLNNTRDLGGIAVTEGFGLIEEDIAAMREMYLE